MAKITVKVGLVALFFAACLGSGSERVSSSSAAYIPAHEYLRSDIFQLDKALQASTTPENATYVSEKETVHPVQSPGIAFSAVGLTWNEYVPANTSALIYMKFLHGAQWSGWNLVERDIDHKETDEKELGADGLQSAFVTINPAIAYQYKVVLDGDGKETPIIKNIKVTTINAKDPPASVASVGLTRTTSQLIAQINQDMISPERVKIISRAEWGADEGLRVYKGNLPEVPVQKLNTDYQDKFSDELQIVRKVITNEKGEMLSWPQEYPAKISKIIVHHTASTANLADPKKALRDIYYWHTTGRGWGDVGYNYIIDTYGNIYEGRAGGEMVIGAHAGKANTGAIGISVMGNYETGDVTEKSLIALTRLISEKTKIHSIDPVGKSTFRGEFTANILGHREVMATSCPGKNLFDKLPLIAQLARSSVNTTVEEASFRKQRDRGYDFEDRSGILFVDLSPEQSKNLTIQVKNIGTQTWNSETSLVVNDIESIRDFIQVQTPPGRITFPMQSPRNIAPGDTATFTVTLAGGFKTSLKTLKLVPMVNGKIKLGKRIEISVQTAPAQFTYDLIATSQAPSVIKMGTPFTYTVDIKNTGNVNWQNKGNKNVRFGTDRPRDRVTQFLAKPGNRAGFLVQDEVRPGETGRFVFSLIAPKIAGSYEEHFTPMVEGFTWMADKNITFTTFVYDKEYAATPISIAQIEAIPDTTQTATVKVRNMGGLTWTNANAPQLRKTGNSRLKILSSSLIESQVTPGGIGTFSVQVLVPKAFRAGKVKLDGYVGSTRVTSKTLTLNARRVSSSMTPAVPSAPVQPTLPSPPTSVSTSSKGSNVRVLLSFFDTPVISANGFFTVKSGSYTATFSRDTKVKVQPQNGAYQIIADNFFQMVDDPVRFIPDEGVIMRVDNWSRKASWDPNINDNEFRGVLEVRNEGVINELPIEDYLKGLAETLNSDPIEKKKAIVVAARNYVLFYSTVGKGMKFPGKPYDVDDNPEHSQKYVGYGYEKRSPLSVKSVIDTAGIIIKYQGNVVRAPYFSSNTGRTKSAAEVWGWKNADFLVAVDDPYCIGKTQAGHGVGMSGCGSLGMAKEGKSYEDILHYYYKNVTIEKAY